MCEGRKCRHGPSPQRKPFNLSLDVFGVKARLRECDIPYKQIASRAGISSVAVVADVLAGRKRSIYVERALRQLLAEAVR